MSVSSAFIYMTFKRRAIFQLCFHFTASYLNICNTLSSGTDFFYEILSHFFTVKLNKDVFWYLSAAYFDDPRWWVSLFCFLCCASFCRSWLKKLAAWGTAKPSEFNYKSSLFPAADPSLALWLSFPHCYCLVGHQLPRLHWLSYNMCFWFLLTLSHAHARFTLLTCWHTHSP